MGDLAEPGFYPAYTATTAPPSRDRLLERAKRRVTFSRTKCGVYVAPLRKEVASQLVKGWPDEPVLYTGSGSLL